MSPPVPEPNTLERRLRRAAPWACAALVVVGVGCRLWLLLAGQSFWYDEAYLLRNIQLRGFADLLGPTLNNQAAPPFFLWILSGLHALFGAAEWAMRLPAAVGGALSVVVAIPLASRLVGWPAGLWVVAFAALSFQAMTHANDVKPYAIDVLVTELILLAAATCFTRPAARRPLFALLALGALAPWLSYPAVFVLGGVGAAWVLRAIRSREFGGVALFALVGLVSCGLLWYLAVRHQRSTQLMAFTWDGFIDRSGAWQAVTSALTVVRRAGDYSATGLGLPMLVLVPLGWVVMWRRVPDVVVAMAAAFALALAASAAGVYPFGDRLALYAAPLFWLPTAAALGAIVPRLKGAAGVVVLVVLLALPFTDVVRSAKAVWRGSYGTEFREAFQFVESLAHPDDRIWQLYPEVYEVYHGTGRVGFGPLVPPDRVVSESAGHRLWLVSPPDGALEGYTPLADLEVRLVLAGRAKLDERAFRGVVVKLYAVTPSP